MIFNINKEFWGLILKNDYMLYYICLFYFVVLMNLVWYFYVVLDWRKKFNYYVNVFNIWEVLFSFFSLFYLNNIYVRI